MREEFTKTSYKLHENHYQNTFNNEKLNSWKRKDTIDYWRHERMYSNLIPLIDSFPNDKWLTIGDGRYGTDANYIISRGVRNVLATDISDTYLEIALREGFISEFKVENAESLTFDDNSFDFVLCKESYHHFPRPMIALYEMLRVAKKSVILIEPQDGNILIPSRFKIRTLLKWSFQILKNHIKKFIGKEAYYNYGDYEEVGNYVYNISEREIEKVALGLDYEMVSFKGMNDSYIEGVEFDIPDENSRLFKEINKNIENSNSKSNKGLNMAGLLIAMIHKSSPDKSVLNKLEKIGFCNRKLPRNPYR